LYPPALYLFWRLSILKHYKDYLLVGLLGLFCLTLAYQVSYLGLSWYDELIYAVVARNIITEQNLNTNHYRAEAILNTGFPARDVHMPGHMLLMALSFSLFGFTDAASVLPSQISYVLGGILLFEISRRLFNRQVGWIAAICFFVYPVNFVFANTAMGESTVIFLVLVYFWLWVKIDQSPHPLDALCLAVVLALGTIHRETFLIFLPPSLYLTWQWGREKQIWQPVWIFSLTFTVLAIGLIYPLSQNRSYYPNTFNNLLYQEGTGIGSMIWYAINSSLNILTNYQIVTLGLSLGLSEFSINLFHIFVGIVVFGGLYIFKNAQRRFVWLFIFIFWGTIFAINSFYTPPVFWEAIRSIAILMPGGILIMAALIHQTKRWLVQAIAVTIIVLYLGYASYLSNSHWQHLRQDFLTTQTVSSRIINEYLGPYRPKVILSHRETLYAWDHYPVIVVRTYPEDVDQATRLLESIPIDAIVFDEKFRHEISTVMSQLGHPFISLYSHPVEGYYFLVTPDLSNNSKSP
jgi:4-amino-4-deoxy-L-arabinose transferase-like glycosyltransferase